MVVCDVDVASPYSVLSEYGPIEAGYSFAVKQPARVYSVLSEYGPIEAFSRSFFSPWSSCIPCSQSTAPLKPDLDAQIEASQDSIPCSQSTAPLNQLHDRTSAEVEIVFRALRVRPH